MRNIKWGIIGCGAVTEVKSGPALQIAEGSELVAVMRRNAEKAEDYARRHNVARWYSDAEMLINDSEVNAVYVATPPDTHTKYALMALKAGKPVYIEKPMAKTFAECKEIIECSWLKNIPGFVAYYRRALPGFLKIRDLIESNVIGKVLSIQISLFKQSIPANAAEIPWRVNPEISGGGHFFDLASHQLDYLDFLFGPVQKVKAFALNQCGKYKAEDIVSATFLFDKDILCSGTWCFSANSSANRDTFEIIGEKGAITFSCFDFTPITLTTSTGVKSIEYPIPEHVQLPLIQQVVDELLGKGQCVSNIESGARTSWVLDQVVNEYFSGI